MVLQLVGNDVLIEAAGGFSAELRMEDESIVAAVRRNQRSLLAIRTGGALGLVRCLAGVEFDPIRGELHTPVYRRTCRDAGRACRWGIRYERAAIAVRGKIQRGVEIIERDARGIGAVGYREKTGRRIIRFRELR